MVKMHFEARKLIVLMGVMVMILAACTSAIGGEPADDPTDVGQPTEAPTETANPTSPTSTSDESTSRGAGNGRTPEELLGENPPPGAESQFSTDFSIHNVSYSEILSGGPPKDGIPSIDNPKFISVEEADEWLVDDEPVISFKIGDDFRAYPIQILMWHEIVNDVVGGEPVVVTFCPLCNTAIAFKRTVDGEVLDFGTTGRLRFSNLVMYDRQTESWWQQATGEAIAGFYTGTQLEFVNAPIISWKDFKTSYPDGKVLSRDTGHVRSYGNNPYSGYDDVNSNPFLFVGPDTPENLPPMERVLTVDLNGEAVAYPYAVLEEVHVVNDTVGGMDIVVIWQPGTASPFQGGVAGDDVGAADTFSRELNGQTLTFSWDGENIVDDQTGSAWNVLGEAVSGELEGEQLETIVAVNHFWFSWAAFKPETEVYSPEE